MLSNRLVKAIPSKIKQNNYQKSYSLLSIDSLFVNSKNNNGNRELPSITQYNMKKMGKNKQNCDSENFIKGHKKIAQAKISYSRAISSSLIDRELSDNHSMMLDDENSFSNTGIIKNSQLLKLENITNRIELKEHSVKEKYWMNSNVFQSQPFLFEDEDKNSDNRIYVDMKKKIKKISASKKGMVIKQAEKGQRQPKKQFLLNKIYSDSEVIADGCIFRHKLISQRIDNDVDTDDEQIISGIKRLEKSLIDALQQNRITQREKMDIKQYGDNELQFFML